MAKDEDGNSEIRKWIGIGGWILLGLGALMIISSSIYTIRSGSEGVMLTFGRAEPIAKTAGLHFKMPIVQEVVAFDIKTQKYETGAAAASKDLQDVSTNVAVNYHINAGTTPALFSEIGAAYQSRIIEPAVQEVVKSVTAKFTAEELITRRAEVSNDIFVNLKERLASRNIVVETIAITNFAFSASFTAAIEAKVTAEQSSLEQRNLLEKTRYMADQKVATAEGERDSAIAIATGEAQSIRLTAEAEARKVQLIQEQLRQSPEYIDYVKASKWSGELPKFYMTGTGGAPLMLNLPIVNE